jgi:hypothetical protein
MLGEAELEVSNILSLRAAVAAVVIQAALLLMVAAVVLADC